MKRKILAWCLMIIIVGGLVAACARPSPTTPTLAAPKPTATPITPTPAAPKLPAMIAMTTFEPGSSIYMQGSAIREVVEKDTPMKLRVEGYGGTLAKVIPLRSGESQLSLLPSGTGVPIARGIFEAADPGWGPQPMRYVYAGEVQPSFTIVLGTSNIYTYKDLKGKTIAMQQGMMVDKVRWQALLAFGGLTLDDVKVEYYPDLVRIYDAFRTGKVHVALASMAYPPTLQVASSPAGMRILEMPISDTEGWKRFLSIAPFYSPGEVLEENYGPLAGKIPMKSFWGYGQGYDVVAYDHLDENVAYTITKIIRDNHEVLKPMEPRFKFWTKELALDLNRITSYPYHPGSIRYFKELGLWTAKHQAQQEEQLKAEKERMDEFKKDPKAWAKKYAQQ